MKTLTHNPVIDAIRGLCIISVILLHLFIHLPLSQSLLQWIPLPFVNIIFRSGYYGVIIFFVISGYLITSSCLKRFGSLEKINVVSFYKLRFARIAPCLLFLLFILSLLDILRIKGFILSEKHTNLLTALFSALTFQINVLQAKVNYLPSAWDVLWSLSIEETFYLFFPLCCIYLKKSWLYFILLILIIIAPFFRTLTTNDIWSDHGYFSCLDSIAMGILTALIMAKINITSKTRKIILVSSVFLFILTFFFRKFLFILGISKIGLNSSLLSLSIAGILIGLQHKSNLLPHSLIVHCFKWFGKNSYEIYLSHCFVVIGLKNAAAYFHISNQWHILIYVAGILFAGWLGEWISRYFSIPMNQYLRQRLSIQH